MLWVCCSIKIPFNLDLVHIPFNTGIRDNLHYYSLVPSLKSGSCHTVYAAKEAILRAFVPASHYQGWNLTGAATLLVLRQQFRIVSMGLESSEADGTPLSQDLLRK